MVKEKNDLLSEFNDSMQSVEEFNGYYKDAINYLKNTEELYNSYSTKGNELRENKKNTYGEINLNNRISYYENERQQTLSTWHSILWYVYYFLVIVLVLGIIFDKSGRSRAKKIAIVVVAFLFPFFIPTMLRLKNKFYEKYLKNVLPQ
jgi:surface polysaccharide O-acyltransferase-like enzyme